MNVHSRLIRLTCFRFDYMPHVEQGDRKKEKSFN